MTDSATVRERRVLYCSSVTPQNTAAGELLVCRHLQALDTWGVAIVGPRNKPVADSLRFDMLAVARTPPRSIQAWRRGPFFALVDAVAARFIAAQIVAPIRAFAPQVVLSTFVPDQFMTAAARIAATRQLPLVLFCHDDYSSVVPRSARMALADTYRQAAVRLCVSPAMELEFRARYGVAGTVLPPIPGQPPAADAVSNDGQQAVVGIAGTIGYGYVEAMLSLADALSRAGGRLVLASRTPRYLFPRLWAHPAVTDVGAPLPQDVAAVFQREGVNVLAVIQSFAPDELQPFRLNFPSKLTEYSSYGLPLLIVAPAGSSATEWAIAQSGSALVVTDPSPAALATAIRRLHSPGERLALARGFVRAASAFEPRVLQRRFDDALVAAACGQPAMLNA